MDILAKIKDREVKLSGAANQIAQHSGAVQQLQGYMARLQEEIKELQAGNEGTDSDKAADTSAEQQVSAA